MADTKWSSAGYGMPASMSEEELRQINKTIPKSKSRKEIEEELEKLKQENEQLKYKLENSEQDRLRALADYQNLVKRTQKERLKMVKEATQGLTRELVPHLDHLALAAQHSQDKGLQMVIDQLWKTLQENGVREIQCLGKPFDPNLMEAVEVENEEELLDNSEKSVVTAVVRRGYMLHDLVLQVAKVKIG